MKNKIPILLLVSAIVVTGLSYKYYFVKQPTVPITETTQTEITLSDISIDDFALKLEQAVDNNDTGLVWEMMHPDEQKRWRASGEYAEMFNKHNRDGDFNIVVVSQTVNKVEDTSFTHPVTGKTYQNAKRVVIEKTTEEGGFIDTYIRGTYFAKENGRWGFFSTLISNQDRENLISEDFTPIDYKLLEKEPGKYAGEKVKYTGEISQISESNGIGFLLMNVTKDEYDWWTDSIYVGYSSSTNAVEDDIVTVYGHIIEPVTYDSVAGWEITVPSVEAWVVQENAKSI